MEHIEEAGIHSGDSSCTLPPVTLGRAEVDRVRVATRAIAEGVGVRGLLNVQFAIGAGRALRARGEPAREPHRAVRVEGARHPARQGRRRASWWAPRSRSSSRRGMLPASDGSRVPLDAPVAVKEAVLPFHRFRTREGIMVDSVLGPEMRSTGEVMGIDRDFPTRVRQEPARRVRRDAAVGHRVRLGLRPRQARHHPPASSPAATRLRDRRDRGHRRGAPPQRHRGAQVRESSATSRTPTRQPSSTSSTAARSTWS